MSKEQELQDNIAKLSASINATRDNIAALKMQAFKAESDLVYAKLQREKLEEELATIFDQNPKNVVKTMREQEIDRFREAMPGCMERLNKEDELK